MYVTLKRQVYDTMCASLAKTKNTSSTADKYFRYFELDLSLRHTLNALKLITHDQANAVCNCHTCLQSCRLGIAQELLKLPYHTGVDTYVLCICSLLV